MHLDMNKDLLRINNYMQVLLITPKPPVSILKWLYQIQVLMYYTFFIFHFFSFFFTFRHAFEKCSIFDSFTLWNFDHKY